MSNDQPDQGAIAAPFRPDPATDPASWAPTEPGPRCPWCSAALVTLEVANCPSCSAQLARGSQFGVPGLTEVAPAARPASSENVRRNRLLAWISGEVVDDEEPAAMREGAAEALAPPSPDVRREILRLQLEAAGIHVPADEPEPASQPAGDAAAALARTDPSSTGEASTAA